MKNPFSILVISLIITLGCKAKQHDEPDTVKTVCNPLDISYRFQLDEPSRREAADPTVVLFQDNYYLFASKSGGYWYSQDLVDWTLISTDELPVEDYAPTVVAIGDTLYFLASSNHANIYKTTDPRSGKWTIAKSKFEISLVDPDFFLDDNNRLYLYWGCSNNAPLWGIEIDYKNGFKPIGERVALISSNPSNNGWEVPGDYNTKYNAAPWIEGAWLNKHHGKYYLQYACPGTEYRSYADGIYVAESPLGPYKQAKNNPFAYKPSGFISGAGHGSTFADKYGNYWHIGTVTISVKHMFERRLALFPAFFDTEGELYCNTALGDFPMVIPDHRITGGDELFPGWMLLSYKKDIQVSSSLDGHSAEFMTDEDIRTYWSAVTGSSDEWVKIDLGMNCDVYALQLNFAEQNTTILGRKDGLCFKYSIEISSDNKHWEELVDNSENSSDNSHHYIQLDQKVKCRYLRLKNIRVADGCFALSGFRVFGKGNGNKPDEVNQFLVDRESGNRRTVHLSWEKEGKATGYLISFGTDENKLYHDYMVYSNNEVTINSLNVAQPYFFKISAFNENGVTDGSQVIKVE